MHVACCHDHTSEEEPEGHSPSQPGAMCSCWACACKVISRNSANSRMVNTPATRRSRNLRGFCRNHTRLSVVSSPHRRALWHDLANYSPNPSDWQAFRSCSMESTHLHCDNCSLQHLKGDLPVGVCVNVVDRLQRPVFLLQDTVPQEVDICSGCIAASSMRSSFKSLGKLLCVCSPSWRPCRPESKEHWLQ